MISTTELAFLNYYFYSNIGDSNNSFLNNRTHSGSVEEKILTYSNSYNYAYKNLLQFISSNKNDYLYEKSSKYYFKNIYINIILNLLRYGKNSLAVGFLKKFINFIFRNEVNNFTKETIEMILNLLFEVYEYDTDYVVGRFWDILNNFGSGSINNINNINNQGNLFDHFIFLLKQKFISFRGGIYNFYNNKESIIYPELKNNVYYCTNIKYLKFQSYVLNIQYDHNNFIHDKLLKDLIEFKTYCKSLQLNRFKLLSNILITKLYIKQGKITESLFNINKIISKSNDEYLLLKSKLVLTEIYSKIKNMEKVESLLSELEIVIENIGNITDKFEFYSLKSQFDFIRNSNENISSRNSINISSSIFKCIKYAILSNNSKLITNALILYEIINNNSNFIESIESKEIVNKIQNHINQTNSLLYIFDNFTMTPYQEMELITVIQINNKNIIKILKFN
jgi:hypothetical protein